MTDLERLLEWYRSVGIEPLVETVEKYHHYFPDMLGSFVRVTLSEIHGPGKRHPNVGGYPGFHTTLAFTPEGKFIRQDFWE